MSEMKSYFTAVIRHSTWSCLKRRLNVGEMCLDHLFSLRNTRLMFIKGKPGYSYLPICSFLSFWCHISNIIFFLINASHWKPVVTYLLYSLIHSSAFSLSLSLSFFLQERVCDSPSLSPSVDEANTPLQSQPSSSASSSPERLGTCTHSAIWWR